METVLKAAAFAAEKHRTQRRKDIDTPFINHPIQLAYILVQADIEDPVVLAAALLHDTIEDTQTTHDEIEIVFGSRDREHRGRVQRRQGLTKLERKQAQIDHAATHQSQGEAGEARRQDRQRQRHQRRAAGGLVAGAQARVLRLGQAGGGSHARHARRCWRARFDAEYRQADPDENSLTVTRSVRR
jgi:hypothetical protein